MRTLVALAVAGGAHGFVVPFGGVAVSHPQCATASNCVITMAARVPFIAGNWKMNPVDLSAATSLAKEVRKLARGCGVEVSVIPPHPFLVPVLEQVEGSKVQLGAQNLYLQDRGAFTGAVSVSMLKSVGCAYVLVGHSERRVIFKDDDAAINSKLRKV
ncbi:unnamed protein product, partial [Phaeothamnion confervicola]